MAESNDSVTPPRDSASNDGDPNSAWSPSASDEKDISPSGIGESTTPSAVAEPPSQVSNPVGEPVPTSESAFTTDARPATAKDTTNQRSSRPPSAGDTPKKKKRKRSFWIELPILVVVAVLVAVLVRSFVMETFYIPSGSMENTLVPNDRVLVNKLVYDFRDPHRGEVIVFKPPRAWDTANKDDFTKRVVGVPGDHILCCDKKGNLTINGKALKENYLYPGDRPSEVPFEVTVPKGHLFVLGDHRSESADSRAHLDVNHGMITIGSVVGRAFAIYWPLNHWGTLPVPKSFDAIPGG